MENENLIEKIWNEKDRSRDLITSETMYVAVSSGRPSMARVTANFLETLSQDAVMSERWARSWGKVFICVGPQQKDECVLGDNNDNRNKIFIPLQTTLLLNPSDFFADFPKGNLGKIIVNNQPMTVEALLITYLHMADELIWQLSKKEGSYKKALELIKSQGFEVNLDSEKAILNYYGKFGSNIRLYGSGVNKFVPKVMGAVVIN